MNPAAGDLLPGSLAASMLGAAWTLLLALLLGAAILPRRAAGAVTTLLAWTVMGVAAQATTWLALSAFGALRPGPVLATAAAATLLGALGGGRRALEALRDVRASKPDRPGLALAGLLVLVATWAWTARLAVLPTHFYDDLVYHLGLPRQALLSGRWPAMPDVHYSLMPAGWDAAYVLPLALGGGSGPQFLNTALLAGLALVTFRIVRRSASVAAAATATSLLLASSMLVSLGAFAGNDLFVGFALAVALLHLLDTGASRPLLTGALAGAAWAAKYTALPAAAGIAVAAALVRAPRAERLRRALLVGLATLAVGLPWTLRTWMLTGNPLYPAFFGVLGGDGWSSEAAALVARDTDFGAVESRGLSAFALALVDLALRPELLGHPSGIAPAFLPLALAGLLLARRIRDAPQLLCVALATYSGWCLTSLTARFAIVLLVVLAPFAGVLVEQVVQALDRLGRRASTILAAGLLLAATLPPLHDAISEHLRSAGIASAWRLPSREGFLESRVALAAAGREMGQRLPADARILLVGEGRFALLPRRVQASSAYDRPAIARHLVGGDVEATLDRLRADVTHVVVNTRELRRLDESYAHAGRLEPAQREVLAVLMSDALRPVARWGPIVLFEVPPDHADAAPPGAPAR